MSQGTRENVVTNRRILGLALLATTALTAPAFAQGAEETVYVTAQKRVERNVDVPISITVNTAEDIKNKNIGDLTELGQKMPNVNAGGTLFASVNIRGITSNSAGAGAGAGFPPDVGANVDEVFMGRDRAFDSVLVDVSSVEVLRGPQATLYGKNTIAGVINVTTNRPTNDYEAIADVRYGNLDYWQLRGTVSGPIIEDKLLLRASGFYQSRDGYINAPNLGTKVGSLNQYGGHAMLVANPFDNFTFEIRADINKEDDTNGQRETVATLNGTVAPFAPFNTVPAQNPYDRSVDINIMPIAKRDIWGTSAKAEYTWNNYTFTSITAWRHMTSDYNFDQDGGPLDGFDTGLSEGMRRFSQEFRITSPGDQRLSWIAGAYFDHESDTGEFHIHTGPGFPTFLFGPPFPALLPANFSEAAQTNSTINAASWAGFVSGKFDITDKLKLSGGIRFTHEKKDLKYQQLPTILDPIIAPLHVIYAFAMPILPLTDNYRDDALSGDATLQYSFTPNQVAYARFAHGFKAGGFQADIISPPFNLANGLAFKPETLNSYEVGFKSILFDGALTANASAFYYDFSNKQEQVNTGVSFVVSNAASATSKGLELELNWMPVDGLTLFANGGYLDAKYDQFPNGGGVGINYDGNQLAGASKYSASWGGNWTAPLEAFPGTNYVVATDWDYRASQFTDPANTRAIRVEPFMIINARVGVESDDGRWGAYVWGRNLGDRTVLGGGVDVIGGLYISRSVNIGRTYGIELRART